MKKSGKNNYNVTLIVWIIQSVECMSMRAQMEYVKHGMKYEDEEKDARNEGREIWSSNWQFFIKNSENIFCYQHSSPCLDMNDATL